MRHLDLFIGIGTPVDFGCFGEELQSLRLTEQFNDEIVRYQFLIPPAPSLINTNLKSLTLSNLYISKLFEPLSRYCSFPALTHLSLLQCVGVKKFILALTEASSTTRLYLEHMAVDFEEEASDGRDVPLASLFQVCGPLKSLHIHHLHGLANFPYKVLADNICASGEHLKLLSLGMFNDADLVAYDPINDQEFDRVCRACTNLHISF
jgi:hypothetical protein